MNDEEFLAFMKQSLPQYVVQCFLYSGYDTARVVAQMNTDNGPTNSIDQIEAFILQNFPSEESCYHMSLPSKFYVFTPGHRTRILNFIEDVKQSLLLYRPGKHAKQQPTSTCNKKLKTVHCGIDKDSFSECSHHSYDLKEASESVRDRIIKWMRKQTKDLQELKEHQHYKVNVRLQQSGYLTVDVLCLLCDSTLRLGQKKDEHGKCMHLISNWTNHIVKCLEKKKSKQQHGKQVAISSFFGTKPKDCKLVVEETSVESFTKEDFQQAPPVQVNQEGQL